MSTVRRITLSEIYRDDPTLFSEGEMLALWVESNGVDCLDDAFTVRQMPPEEARNLLGPRGGLDTVLDLFDRLGKKNPSRALVKEKMRDFEDDRIIVVAGDCVMDGNHHLVAALHLGRPVFVIDLEEDLEAEPDADMDGP